MPVDDPTSRDRRMVRFLHFLAVANMKRKSVADLRNLRYFARQHNPLRARYEVRRRPSVAARGVELLTRSRRASLLNLLYALCSGRRFGRRRKGIIRTEEQHSLWDGSHVRPYALTCLLLQLDNPMAPFTRSWRSDGRRRRVAERRRLGSGPP